MKFMKINIFQSLNTARKREAMGVDHSRYCKNNMAKFCVWFVHYVNIFCKIIVTDNTN